MFDVIMVANTAEAFKRVLLKDTSEEGIRRLSHELTLSQRAFFWGSDNKAVITPFPIPEALMDHNRKICNYTNVENRSPIKDHGANLSRPVWTDKNLRRFVTDSIKENPALTLSPYAFTDDFLWLLGKINKAGMTARCREWPRPYSLWTTAYLDSKSGFRAEMLKLAADHEEIRVPEGFVAQGIKEARQIAHWFCNQWRSVILKADFGESGWGILHLEPDTDWFLKLVSVVKEDVIWKQGNIVVEETIQMNLKVAGGSPSTEVFVSDDGPVITYHCGQLLNLQGGFLGVEIGNGAVLEELADQLDRIGMIIGKRYWELGYRGFFDIDFVVSRDNLIYVAETNTRRTGGTHAYDLAKHLFGDEWASRAYLLSHDSFRYTEKRMTPEEILAKLKPILYPIRGKNKGIILTLASDWDPIFGYIAIAPNRSEGRALQKQLFGIFGK